MGKVSQNAAASSRRHGQDAVGADELETLPLTSARAAEERQDDDVPELPSYDDSEASVAAHQAGRSDVDGGVNGVSHAQPTDHLCRSLHGNGEGSETISVMDERLNDPVELRRFIEETLAVAPPGYGVKVVGTHKETRYNNSSKKTEESTVEDFSITMSMRQYLGKPHDQRFWGASVVTDGDDVFRGSWKRTRAVEHHRQDIEIGDDVVPDLQDWCHHFCKSTNFLKVFRITRSVYGVDEEYLRKNIERVIRTTHYHGKVNVSFYTGARHVDIRAPHWINTVRTSPWAIFFYVTFLWIITWPLLFFATAWWTVYTVRWNWVYSLNDDEQQHVHKIYAGVSEKAWIDIHQNLLKSLAMEKFKGDASSFPKNVSDARVARMMGEPGTADSSSSLPHVNHPLDAAENSRIGLWNDSQRSELRDPRAWGDDR